MNQQLRDDWREVDRVHIAVANLGRWLTKAKPVMRRLADDDPQFDLVLAAVVRMQLETDNLAVLLDRLVLPPELTGGGR